MFCLSHIIQITMACTFGKQITVLQYCVTLTTQDNIYQKPKWISFQLFYILLTINCNRNNCPALPITSFDVCRGTGKGSIMKTSPCNEHQLTPHFYIENWVYRGISRNFLIFALKRILWVLVRTASTCTHNQCFEQK